MTIPVADDAELGGGEDPMFKALLAPMPFCGICMRFLTPHEARAHKQHARAIRWPKPKKK